LDRVDGLPGYQHRQHGGLTGAGRHLGGDTKQARIVGFVPGPKLVADGAMLRLPRRHLLKPDDRLDSLDLAEEQWRLGFARPPMVEQSRSLMSHARLADRQCPPALDVAADLVDQRVLGCFLSKREAFLPRFPRLRNRHQVLAASPAWLDLRGERAALVQSPMTARREKRRVEDRILRGEGHSCGCECGS
jgi:hypothetical protein